MNYSYIFFIISLLLLLLLLFSVVFIYQSTTQLPTRPIKFAIQTCKTNNLNELLEEVLREKEVQISMVDELFKDSIEKGSIQSTVILPCGYTYLEKEMESLQTTSFAKSGFFFGIDGCDMLVSKNLLWRILENFFSESIIRQWIPKTYLLSNPKDIDTLVHIYSNNQDKQDKQENLKPIIFKKNIQRKEGLLLTKSPREILFVLKSNHNKPDGYVVAQEFIQNSLKVYGHKLNMRIYILAIRHASTSQTQFYLHSFVKCIYANVASSGTNDMRLEVNITSLNLNKETIYNKRKFPLGKDDLAKYLEKETLYTYEKDIWYPLIKVMRQTILPFRTLLGKNKKYSNTTRFQLFGGDIIFEEISSRHSNQQKQLKPLLLEFNKGPDMSFSNSEERELKKQVLQDSFDMVSGKEDSKNFSLL